MGGGGSRGALPLWLTLGAIVAVAAALRLFRYEVLSLWLDEVITVGLARELDWPAVLGFRGVYDSHPPLFHAVVKAVLPLTGRPEDTRLISVVAGTATVPLAYALVASLVGRPAGLATAALLAISPIHVWYSQEIRQYATVVLLVTVTYLALVRFDRTLRPRWAAVYGLTAAVALYTDYSAAYALGPQALVLLLLLARHGRRALPVWLAGALAVAAFLPWLPQVARTAHDQTLTPSGDTRFPAWSRLAASLFSLLGLFGGSTSPHAGGYFSGRVPSLWDQVVLWERPAFVPIGAALVIGALALHRRSFLALAVAVALVAGTLATGLGLSLLLPLYYVERAFLPVSLGLALLLGAAVACPWRRLRPVAAFGVAVVAVMNLSTLSTIYDGAEKQHWRELAVDAGRLLPFGQLLVTYPGPAGAAVGMYNPGLGGDRLLALPDGTPLPAEVNRAAGDLVLWYAYLDLRDPITTLIFAQLKERGYQRLLQRPYGAPLFLDLWVQPDATLGAEILRRADSLATWRRPPAGLAVGDAVDTGREVEVPAGGVAELTVPVAPARLGLYTFALEVRADEPGTIVGALPVCSPYLDVRLPPSAEIEAGADWQGGRVAAVCPETTTALRLEIHAVGTQPVQVRNLSLQASAR